MRFSQPMRATQLKTQASSACSLATWLWLKTMCFFGSMPQATQTPPSPRGSLHPGKYAAASSPRRVLPHGDRVHGRRRNRCSRRRLLHAEGLDEPLDRAEIVAEMQVAGRLHAGKDALERTMNTFLGAAQNLSPDDVKEDDIAAAAITYMEGYLWDPKDAKEAFRKAAKIAHGAGRTVALTLSDSFCVDRYRAEFLELIKGGTVDLLFANEHELKSLYETGEFEAALDALKKDAKLGVVTRSEKGAVVVGAGKTETVPVFPVERVVDATGAGDLFAAGFLHGYAKGLPHADSARLGALAAAEVISHIGARPERKLADLAKENGLKV
jgi:hypothetical protein